MLDVNIHSLKAKVWLWTLSITLYFISQSATAELAPDRSVGPLYVKNLSPVAALLGLPSPRHASTEAPGSLFLALHSSLSSHYISQNKHAEQVTLDGETLRYTLEARYGITDDWDIQVEVPWLKHSGGHLDSMINSWHHLWGMPDGGRPDVAKNNLNFNYLDATAGFSLTDPASGLGDISLALSHTFFHGMNSSASAVLGYKFATGDADQLLGSGENDAFLALRFSAAHWSDLPLNWHGQLGLLHAGSNPELGRRQKNNLWFAGLSLDWIFTENTSLFAQLDMHAAPLNSKLSAFGDDALLASLGLRWSFSKHWSVDMNFVEDLRVKTGPDITFQASFRYRPM